MATSTEKNGILIIYETDGHSWASHFESLITEGGYEIPCRIEHWWNLNSKDAMYCPVHVLVLSPLMEANINHEKLFCIRNDSETSLLLECNVNSKRLQMPKWKVIEKIDTTLDKQRNILMTLVEMFEVATNDDGVFLSNEPIPIDIVPTCLYPGDRTIHIMFSTEPAGEITIQLQGRRGALPTKKHTTNTYTCDLPDIEPGQKIISVLSGNSYSLYTTKIVIVTPDALIENFIKNLQDTLGAGFWKRYSGTYFTMGVDFNPFSEELISRNSLKDFGRQIEVISKSSKYDSGFFSSPDEDHYETINNSAGHLPHKVGEIEDSMRTSMRFENQTSQQSKSNKSRNIGTFFKRLLHSASSPDFYSGRLNRRSKLSRRARMARSQDCCSVPSLPPPNIIVYEQKMTGNRV